jgi:dTDP-4-dehydrorhamnose reductase
MRILVTGSSGLLGLNLCLASLISHQVIGVDRSRLTGVPFELINQDLLVPGSVEKLLSTVKPEAVIHCAALADMEACEKDPSGSQKLNGEYPGELAGACREQGVQMLHISTDGVFDGTKDGFYSETDEPNPQGVYARTKLEGEQAVLGQYPQAIVARVNFFGWSLNGKHSLAEFFVNNLRAGKTVNGFMDVHFCPLFVGDLAGILVKLLEKKLSGLYHVVGSETTSKYEFGKAIAHKFGLDENLIQPISVDESGMKARRSHNLRLSVHKLSTALGMDIPGFSTGLEWFYTQAQQGYPQKIAGYQQVKSN